MEFQMPLRGWYVAEVTGSKFVLANAELRYPFLTALFAGETPFFVQGMEVVVFSDMGTAFNNKIVYSHYDDLGIERQDFLLSSGLGLRAYVLGIPVKFDIAWRREIGKWSKPVYLWSLGYDF
jgi:outer membrane protein assembly factor BamA